MLKSIVARPVTVTALTERKRASMYDTRFSPLEAYKMMENKRGAKVLWRELIRNRQNGTG